MNRFLAVMGKVGHVFMAGAPIAQKASPLIALIPTFGPLINTAIAVIVTVEQAITAPGSGAQKSAIAVPVISTMHPEVDPAVIQAVINGLVQMFNEIAALEGKPPAVTPPSV